MARRDEPQPALGRALRQLRTERGLSQEELGHAADIHPTWISHLESGRENPAWGTVARLCVALGIRVSELAALEEELSSAAGEPGRP